MIVGAVPCNRRRLPEVLGLLVSEGFRDVDEWVVVTTMPDPILPGDLPDYVHLVVDETPPPENINFARWCNLGMDKAQELGATEILNVNSDIRLNPGALSEMRRVLREYDQAMVGVDFFRQVPGEILFHTELRSYGLMRRVSAACFLTPGEQTLRMDEEYRWHCESDDFEYECRKLKGTAIVGTATGFQPPDTPIGERWPLVEAGRARFIAKWGFLPW